MQESFIKDLASTRMGKVLYFIEGVKFRIGEILAMVCLSSRKRKPSK